MSWSLPEAERRLQRLSGAARLTSSMRSTVTGRKTLWHLLISGFNLVRLVVWGHSLVTNPDLCHFIDKKRAAPARRHKHPTLQRELTENQKDSQIWLQELWADYENLLEKPSVLILIRLIVLIMSCHWDTTETADLMLCSNSIWRCEHAQMSCSKMIHSDHVDSWALCFEAHGVIQACHDELTWLSGTDSHAPMIHCCMFAQLTHLSQIHWYCGYSWVYWA